MKLSRNIAAVLLIAVAASAFALNSGSSSGASANNKTLTVVQNGDVTSFDPSQLDLGNWAYFYQIYDTLTLENSSLQPQPRLATSWEFSRNRLVMTLHLRTGVEYSDGTPFTAQDVVWNIHHYQSPATGAQILQLADQIVSVHATGAHTVVLHFAHTMSNIFDALDLIFMSKPQPEVDMKTKPIGTGPFKLDQWQPGIGATYSRNEHYWNKDEPKVQTLVIKDASSPEAALAIFEAHQADVILQPSSIAYASLRKQSGVQTVTVGLGASKIDIIPNVTKPPFNNTRVRQAISYALNRSAFVKSYFDGQSSPWCLPWNQGTPAFEAAPQLVTSCPQNLAKAKQLLTEAGYPHGFNTTILTSTEAYLPGSSALAVVLQQDLAQIGINLTIDSLDPAAAKAAIRAKDFGLVGHLYGRANRSAATIFEAGLAYADQGSLSGFSSPEYTRLVTEVEQTLSATRATTVYRQLDSFLLNQQFDITVALVPFPSAWWKSSVSGVTFNLDAMPLFENAS